MTKNELVYTVAHQAQMTRIAAAAAVNTTFEVIITSLKNGAEVRISGFGKFSILQRATREGRSPAGIPVQINAAKLPRFSASKSLKDKLNDQ